jgi:hypothetical protein
MKKNFVSSNFVLLYKKSQSQTFKSKCFHNSLVTPQLLRRPLEKIYFNFDVLASFWKSINGKPSQFYTFTPEYRSFQEIDRDFI